MSSLALLFILVLLLLLFSVLFSIVITSLEEERAGLCASHAIVYLFLHALISVFFLFLLASGVGCGL